MPSDDACAIRAGRASRTSLESKPDIVFRSDDNLTTQRLVAIGLGVAIVPLLTIERSIPELAWRSEVSNANMNVRSGSSGIATVADPGRGRGLHRDGDADQQRRRHARDTIDVLPLLAIIGAIRYRGSMFRASIQYATESSKMTLAVLLIYLFELCVRSSI